MLVVEDEELMRAIIVQLLRREGYEVFEANAGRHRACRSSSTKKSISPILDLNLSGGGSGLDLLGKMHELDSEVMGIIVTAYASIESAVEALRQGAYDYITKPFANDHLKAVVRKALEYKAAFRENRFLRRELREKYRFESIIGKCDAIDQVFRVMEKVARTDSSVLITGESGTGKELVARAIHFSSERANKRFLPINCGALPENLLESELFGYKRGAFTGASQEKSVCSRRPTRAPSSSTKSAICRPPCRSNCCAPCRNANVIRSAPMSPSHSTCACSARPTRTSNAKSHDGRFREELLYRINVITIELPPLRERKDDIALLANHFLRKYEKPLGRSAMRFSKGAMRVMIGYGWPGQRPRTRKCGRARRDSRRNRRHPCSRSARKAPQHQHPHRRCRSDRDDAGGASSANTCGASSTRSAATRSRLRRSSASTSRRSIARSSVIVSKMRVRGKPAPSKPAVQHA